MNINGLIMADLHWGAIDPDEFADEISKLLYPYIEKLDVIDGIRLDYIIIAGDLFDTKETFSSQVTKQIIIFLAKLLFLTRYWETEIILIEGTRTHDNLQLDTLKVIFDSCDVYRLKVIDTVTAYNIGDATMLFIPEEYVSDQDAYYEKYFIGDAFYDIIVGHGMIDKIWYSKKPTNGLDELTKHMSAPVFKVKELLNHCSMCYFGHIHQNKSYGDKGRFKYIGPFTRWEFGNDTKVGFYHVTIDTDTHEVSDKYIENELAKWYPTHAFTIDKDITLTELNDKIDTIIAKYYVKHYNIGRLRLIINLSDKVETWQTIKSFLIDKLGNRLDVKTVLNIMPDIDGSTDETESTSSSMPNYVFDHTIDIAHRIQQFIQSKSGRDIPIETIEQYLEGDDDNGNDQFESDE